MKNKNIPELMFFRRDIEVLVSHFEAYAEHRHEFYEFEYIVEGSGEYIVNGQTFALEKDDLVFVTPMDLHSYKKGKEKFKTITVKFVPESLCFQLRDISKLDSFLIRCESDLKDAFLIIETERSEKEYNELAIKNALERILILILRKKQISTRKSETLEFEKIIGYINQNFRNSPTLEEVAKKCGYSNAHFCRQFRKTTGMTFIEYLNNLRVSHTKNLLLTTKMTITDISYDCGFGSVRNLNREFLKKYKCSPKEFRNRHNT